METPAKSLQSAAREIFDAALNAVNAGELTRKALTVTAQQIRIGETEINPGKPIYVVSIGKAAAPMAFAINDLLGDRVVRGLVSCQLSRAERLSSKWQWFQGGHPLPNSNSIDAAEAASALLADANAQSGTVIFAISGGGSAMIERPISANVSLDDLREANRLLVSCGATIAEINTVRRAFSAVKGGKLASLAPKAQAISLIISDTSKGDYASVASGPSLSPLDQTLKATEVVQRYRLGLKLPASILEAITHSESQLESRAAGSYTVLADNETALQAAAARAAQVGFKAIIAAEISEQPVEEGSELLLQRINSESGPVCLISGGEFSCPVRGDGHGGRNSETVLRSAIVLANRSEHIVVLSAGTDGIDGKSPAAGAIADETTLRRAQALGLDAEAFLARSDSYGFFRKLGDAIMLGPTGTNVRDVRLLLKTE